MFNQFLKIFILIANLFLLCFSAHAQKSVLTGKLVDKKTGETIIGATIMLFQEGAQKTGGVTDIDGNYNITTAPGSYKVEMSYAGYAKIVVDDQQLKSGIANVLDVAMEEESISLEAVIITAQTVKNTDASLISIQRKSISIQDGVSSQQISRTGSSNAADAMKQMTGAVVEGGKFVVMRGLGDRYSLSQLNGITLPSTDPYRNSASLDLIPSQSIENIITVKTFTPDLPGNFSGGLVNVNTKAFPEKLNVYLQVGQEYNTQSSMIHDFKSQAAGKTDWLGFEDGSRDQPSYLLDENNRKLLSSSTYLSARNPDPKNDYVRDIFNRSSKDLSNEFTHTLRHSPLNSSLNFGLGNKSTLFGRDLGYSFGVNYSSTFSHYDNGNVSTFIYNNPYELFAYQDLKEIKSTENPQLGALVNLSYRISQNNQVSFNYIFNNDAEIVNRSQSGSYLGQISESSSLFNTNTLEYTQRQFGTYQILGRHLFPTIGNCELEWMASTTNSFQNEPDLRYFAYTKTGEGDIAEYNINNAEFAFPYHFFRNLTDKMYSSKFDISIPFLTKEKLSSSNRIKVGAFYNGTNRNFEEYRYQLNNTGVSPQIGISTFNGDWNQFFNPSNFGIVGTEKDANGNITRYSTGYHYINQVSSRNFYSGSENIFAAYGMVVYDLTEKLKVIGGVRLEKTLLEVESQDTGVAKGNIDLTDILYSGNLIYSLTDKSNIRLAVTQTLARPNMRELAPFEQFDTKNGFFNVGNPTLKRTLIKNFDIRYELYPRLGELISLSAFAKTFENPIIRAFNPRASIPELGFVNIDQAMVYGVELELRKNLDFMGRFFKNFYVSSNFAVIHSSYKIPTEEFENSKRLFSEYNTRTRPFQGQAPYIANVILSYIDGAKGWESTLAFNVSGEKLYNIALFATPDVYEQEFPSLNFKLTKKFADHYQVSFAARNLLNSISKRTQQFQGKEYISESYSLGTGFGLSVAYFIR